MVVLIPQLVVDHDQALGIVRHGQLPGHADAAVQLDALFGHQGADAAHAELGGAQRSASRAVRQLTAARGLEDGEEAIGGNRGVVGRMTRAARDEMEASEAVLDHVSDGGVKERIASRLGRMEVHGGRRIAKGTGLLATIGSTAPFVGLFGTVWGIMNSFIGISKAQTTNLAIVAP